MDGHIYGVFRYPMGFSDPVLWILPIILLTVIQTLVLLHLGLRSVGVVRSARSGWLPALIISIIGYFARRLLLAPYHALIFTFILFLLILIIGHLDVLSALIATIFSQVVAACGTMIILEPMILLANVRILEISLENPFIYCVGVIVESLAPAIALYVFVRNKLSLFGRLRKDALQQ